VAVADGRTKARVADIVKHRRDDCMLRCNVCAFENDAGIGARGIYNNAYRLAAMKANSGARNFVAQRGLHRIRVIFGKHVRTSLGNLTYQTLCSAGKVFKSLFITVCYKLFHCISNKYQNDK